MYVLIWNSCANSKKRKIKHSIQSSFSLWRNLAQLLSLSPASFNVQTVQYGQ